MPLTLQHQLLMASEFTASEEEDAEGEAEG